MATTFETHLIPFQNDIEILENQIQVIRSFTRDPKVPFMALRGILKYPIKT